MSIKNVAVFALAASLLYGCSTDANDAAELSLGPSFSGTAQTDSLAPIYGLDSPDRIPGRYIVRFKPQVRNPVALTQQLSSVHGARPYNTLESLGGFWGEIPEQSLEGIMRNPNVAYIEADQLIPVSMTPDVIQSNAPWGLDRIDQRLLPLNTTYSYPFDGSGVHIWIIDTGVDRNSPDLAGRIDESWSVTYNNTDPYAPCHPHGSIVATVAAGSTKGVAKGAIVHSARVSDDCAEGGMSTGASASAFEFIADNSPRPAVINYSAGHNCHLSFCWQTVDDAAKYARASGVTVVVAAGNDGMDACDQSPAHVAELITVAASDNNDARADFGGSEASNWGSCVDIFAPGLGIASYGGQSSGTSVAAPFVTGVAAIILQEFPAATPTTIETAIYQSATSNQLSNIGSGSPNLLLYNRRPPDRRHN